MIFYMQIKFLFIYLLFTKLALETFFFFVLSLFFFWFQQTLGNHRYTAVLILNRAQNTWHIIIHTLILFIYMYHYSSYSFFLSFIISEKNYFIQTLHFLYDWSYFTYLTKSQTINNHLFLPFFTFFFFFFLFSFFFFCFVYVKSLSAN